MSQLLILDSDRNLCTDVCNFFAGIGHDIQQAHEYDKALALIDANTFDVVVSSAEIVGGKIRDLVRHVNEISPNTVVLVNSEIDTVEEGVRAVKEGAFGILQKPFNMPELNFQIKKAIESKSHRDQSSSVVTDRYKNVYQPSDFIGASNKIKEVFRIVNRVAKTDSSVIITGETGTGKELVAGAIHYNSSRSEGPFVRVNCAALPEQLLESELFGYEKGAFTGADKLRVGRFEQADGGTIFLDEVADMSHFTQAKVLRVIQEKEFERLGSSESVRTDVRIISATNKDLHDLMEKDLFRQDLYYRLNVLTIHLPPLRDRDGDIRLLIEYFLKKYAGNMDKKISGMDSGALKTLSSYHWPGNIRELENTIERAVLMTDQEKITKEELKLFFTGSASTPKNSRLQLPPEGINMEDTERDFVMQALERTNWVQKEAAQLLGLNSRVLNYKIKRFGITHPRWKQNK